MVPLRRPTADSALLVAAAIAGMRRIYEPGYQLAKCGVMLLDLVESSLYQAELDLEPGEGRDQSHLMGTIDQLNRRFGKRTVFVGSAGVPQAHEWAMRQERRTPQYTTRLSDVPVARA
jgi:DNA polymerase V